VRTSGLALLALGAGLASACSGEKMLRRFTPADADLRAREYLGLFTRHQGDSAEARLAAGVAGPETHRAIARLDTLLAGLRFDSVRVIGAQVSTHNGVRRTNLSYQLHAQRGWFMANVASIDSAGTWSVDGVSAAPIPRPLELETNFTLRGRSILHYVWLALTIASIAFSAGVALFIAIQQRMPNRWRLVLASLVGVGAFSMNWATGEIGVRPWNVELLSAAVVRAGPVAPWVLTFALPIGAILAVHRYYRWRVRTSNA
jgi:hypothetical protein